MQPKKINSLSCTRHQYWWAHLLIALCFGVSTLFALARPTAARTAISTATSVVSWGASAAGTVPGNLSSVIAVDAGRYHSLALKVDGTVVGWGDNSYGQLNIPAGLNNVAAIATHHVHNLALKRNGTVVAWGYNWAGQTNVPANLTNVKAIAAGISHSLAVKTDGTVVGWGWNSNGQSTPPTGLNNVIALAAGNTHSLALKADGTVMAWGDSSQGKTAVPAGLSGVVAIAANSLHNLALKSDGTVVAWGDNTYGQTTVPAGLSGVVAIAAGYAHSMALTADGTVVIWGGNSEGQRNSPAGLTGVTAIAAGFGHSVALIGTAASAPTLSVSGTAWRFTNNQLSVPVIFTSNGASVASVGFALDYQEGCLSFDATDSDGNGVPDAITGLPAAFAPSISHQPSKSSGELEIALYDDSSPISSLSDGTLFTVEFTVKAACLPTVSTPTTVAINFAQSPAATFGTPTGADVAGTATGATITLRLSSVAPTALSLDSSSVAENSAAGTTVGAFTTTDADSGDSHTYTLVSGAGDTDNASFTITGNTLKTAAVFDYESKSSYTIRVRTTDGGGLFFDQSFTLAVTNVYEAPTGVAVGSDGPYSDGNLTTFDLNENAPAGATVATFAPANPNSGSTYTYALVTGAGDNTLFTLSNGVLTANNAFDYETKTSYTVVVRITDQEGNSFEQTLTLTINNLTIETPVAVDDLVDPRVTVFLGGVARAIDVLANDLANGGVLQVASVTQPATGQGSVTNNTTNVSYTAPNASGSSTFTYQATNGTTASNNATVSVNYVANHARGDCNGNGGVSAADFIGVVLEIFDTNNTPYQDKPAWWLSYTGDYAGSPLGCDANGSGNGASYTNNSVTAADIICSVLIFFGHTCGTNVQAAGAQATAHLAVVDAQTSAGATTTLTVTLDTGGNAIAAATFALNLDPALLHFDPADADEDGVPDAITLNTPAGMSKSASWNGAEHRLEVALFGMNLPLPTLSDGTLATVTIAVAADPGATTTPLVLDLVSFSDPDGNDLPFTDQDGTLTIETSPVQRTLFLPLAVRE